MAQNMEELQLENEQLKADKARLVAELEVLRNGGDPCKFAEQRFWNSVNYPIICLDLECKYDFVNKAVCELLEITPESMLGKDALMLTPDPMRATMRETFRNALRGVATNNFRVPRRTTSGQSVWLVVSFSPRFDSRGNINGIISCGQNITDLCLAEREQSRLSRELQELLEQANSPIFSVDNEFKVELWNQNAAKVFGFSREEVVGQPIFGCGLLHESEAEAWRQLILHTRDGDPVSNYKTVMYTKGGEERSVLQNSTLRQDKDGNIVGVYVFLFDITQMKQIADQEQLLLAAQTSNELKSQFLASMSHEIRTPLNIILGNSQLLDEGNCLTPEQVRFVHEIKTSAESLCVLVNDILDLARIESGSFSLNSVQFNLRDLFEEAVESMAAEAHHKGVIMCSYMDPTFRAPLVMGDPDRVRQALCNLLSNAVKFTTSGQICADATVEEHAAPFVTWRFCVRDSGIGVPAEAQGKLFRRFSQVDDATTRSYGGAGIGLALTKELAELMGGSVGVRSELGAGSDFWFSAAFRDVGEAPLASPTPALPASALVLCANDARRQRLLLTCDGLGIPAHALPSPAPAPASSAPPAAPARPAVVLFAPELSRGGEAAEAAGREVEALMGAHPHAAALVLFAADAEARAALAARCPEPRCRVVEHPARLHALLAALRPPSETPPAPGSPRPDLLLGAASDSEARPSPTDPAAAAGGRCAWVAVGDRGARMVLRAMLAKDGWECEVLARGDHVLRRLAAQRPALLVASAALPDMPASALVDAIRAEEYAARRDEPPTPVLVVVATADGAEARGCGERAACRALPKPFSRVSLRDAAAALLSAAAAAAPRAPRRLSRRPSLQTPLEQPGAESGALQGCRVVLAKADVFELDRWTKLLLGWGACVQPATNGAEAVRFTADAGACDVLVADAELPCCAGWEAAAQIRRREEEEEGGEEEGRGQRLPIIGVAPPALAQRCLSAGMHTVLEAPAAPAALLAAIKARAAHTCACPPRQSAAPAPPPAPAAPPPEAREEGAEQAAAGWRGSAAWEHLAGSPRLAPTRTRSDAHERGGNVRACLILVAEDHPVCQRMLRMLLERMGHQVECTANGSEAVASAQERAFDAILMDCNMPVMDGWEATAHIRDRPGPNQATPIIAVTANAMRGDSDKCLAAGMTDYTPKPVMKRHLQELIDKWTGPSRGADGCAAQHKPAPARLDSMHWAHPGELPRSESCGSVTLQPHPPSPASEAQRAAAKAQGVELQRPRSPTSSSSAIVV